MTHPKPKSCSRFFPACSYPFTPECHGAPCPLPQGVICPTSSTVVVLLGLFGWRMSTVQSLSLQRENIDSFQPLAALQSEYVLPMSVAEFPCFLKHQLFQALLNYVIIFHVWIRIYYCFFYPQLILFKEGSLEDNPFTITCLDVCFSPICVTGCVSLP